MMLVKDVTGHVLNVNLDANDTLKEIAAYSHMTVAEIVEMLEEVIRKGYGVGE